VNVRQPSAGGRFYPGGAEELSRLVDSLIEEAPEPRVEGSLVAALAPHAEYAYSGKTAGRVFRALRGRDFDLVAVVGTAHCAPGPGLFLADCGAFRTPLGEVPVASEAARKLLPCRGVSVSRAAHEDEHSIEVQLPFLQRALGRFELLPLAAAGESLEEAEAWGRALAAVLRGRRALLLASSDLSHFPPLETARKVDPAALSSFLSLSPEFLWRTDEMLLGFDAPGLRCVWCGKSAAAAVLAAASELGADLGLALSCDNSALAGGGESRTVGYGAALLSRTGRPAGAGALELGEGEKSELLALARNALEAFLRAGRRPERRLFDRPAFNLPAAVFVTWEEVGGLRGCVGSLSAEDTLGNAVENYAVASATRDPRFPPVSLGELPRLRAEISVLSPMRRISPEEVLPGLGVAVSMGGRKGVFLPCVWEKLPGVEAFMSALCSHKAGLEPDAWRRPGAELSAFTAQAFSER
jgi:AmmeMemoRadiSam system protein B/AmmeMemoRadiSam system protein A